jgi:hypothetical protein
VCENKIERDRSQPSNYGHAARTEDNRYNLKTHPPTSTYKPETKRSPERCARRAAPKTAPRRGQQHAW